MRIRSEQNKHGFCSQGATLTGGHRDRAHDYMYSWKTAILARAMKEGFSARRAGNKGSGERVQGKFSGRSST